MASTAISDVLTQLDGSIQSYVMNGYGALADAMAIPINMALIAYVAFIGLSTIHGWLPLTTGNAVKHTMKIAIVGLLALHWDFFSTMLYDVVTNGPGQLASVLVGSNGTDSASCNAALQKVFNDGIAKGNDVWKQGGPLSTGYYLAAICIYIFDYLSAGFALLEISVAKCGVALTVVLAPIFSAFLLWEGGKGVFASWLKTVFGFALVPLILTSVMILMTPILASGLEAIDPASMKNGMGCLASFILGSFACIGLLFKTPQMAASIAGGLSISAMDAMGSAKAGAGMGRAMVGMAMAGASMASGGTGMAAQGAMKAARWASQKIRG